MAEQKDRCIPQRRFPEFKNDGEWICKSLADVSDCYQGYGFPERLQGKTKGKYPFIKVSDISSSVNKGERYIDTAANYIDEVDVEEIRATPLPPGTIVFAKIGEAIKLNRRAILKQMSLIDNNVAGLKARPTIASDDFLYYILSRIDFSNYAGGVVPAIKKSTIEEIRVAFPPSLTEQQAIASCLSSLDAYIASSKAKLEQLKDHKKGLMQKLFPAPGKTLPEYRFPEFKNEKEWTVSTLGAVTKVVNRRNKSNRVLPVYSISNKRGFILQSEQFDGVDSNERGYDISAYKIVTSNLFAYNPARINVGSWGYSDCIKEGLISSLYVCFKCTNELADDFLKCFMDSYSFQRAVDNNVEGGIRSYLFYENFSRIRIPLPPLQEQKKVASCIISANSKIDLYSERVETLESYKKSLMQRLFP